uniref:DUF6699 domain-containing protein n=1 Tax=Psilocybe cubensis TaxID=181762 RepID=A0A8H8CJJ8_PSICU
MSGSITRAVIAPPVLPRKSTVPLPDDTGSRSVLHPVLSCINSRPGFDWDISLGPWQAEVPRQLLTAPALLPSSTNRIYVRIASLSLYPIVVAPGSATRTNFLTIWDVLVTIYSTIRTEALRRQGLFRLEAYNRFLLPQIVQGEHGEIKREEVYDRNENEVTLAMKKYLNGKTRWFGLSEATCGENTWVLDLV